MIFIVCRAMCRNMPALCARIADRIEVAEYIAANRYPNCKSGTQKLAAHIEACACEVYQKPGMPQWRECGRSGLSRYTEVQTLLPYDRCTATFRTAESSLQRSACHEDTEP